VNKALSHILRKCLPFGEASRGASPRGATPIERVPARSLQRHHVTLGVLLGGSVLLSVGFLQSSDTTGHIVANGNDLSAETSLQDIVVTATRLPDARDLLPQWHEETVGSGDNLSLIFARAGFSERDVYQVSSADGGRALRKIFPGETIAFLKDESNELVKVKHVQSRVKWTTFSRSGSQYSAQTVERSPETRERSATMRIASSLFTAGQQAGLSSRVIMDLAGVFGGVVDFALDPREGDTIELVYEEQYLDGEKFADGDIIAAAFTNKGETYEAYRYTDAAGDTSYYDEQGVSMRKAFLKAPVDFTRVSSNFNPNRLHPIYKTKRPHRGTDYAAPRGTPVYAAGDGRVVEAGYSRANGNYVFIQHGESYKTHYLHLDKRRVKKGERVQQGGVIGTVGSTGAATGPHLHYEFLVNGVHRNPRSVHKILPKAKSLPNTEMARFSSAIKAPVQELALLRQQTRIALAE
jgi:murein DD-endopeptidase MepM/ murein hydrolase activator NlpD